MANGNSKAIISVDGRSVTAPLDEAEALRRDAEARRRDLVLSVAELKRTVSDTLDVHKQTERILLRGKARAADALDRARAGVQARPALVIGVAVGLASMLVAGLVIHYRSRPPRWQRRLQAYRAALSENVYVRIGRPDAP